MQEVQRFNKVLKSLVLLGDLILLNLLLWGFNLFWGTRFWCIHCGSIFQGMTLITLCYLLCNMHSGVILHRPVMRPEQIMIRVLRNMVPFVFFSVCMLLVFHPQRIQEKEIIPQKLEIINLLIQRIFVHLPRSNEQK